LGHAGIFFSPPHPEQICDLPTLVSNVYLVFFLQGKSSQDIHLNTYLQSIVKLKRCGTIPPLLPHIFMVKCLMKYWVNFIFAFSMTKLVLKPERT
jgi:hypothetical protein